MFLSHLTASRIVGHFAARALRNLPVLLELVPEFRDIMKPRKAPVSNVTESVECPMGNLQKVALREWTWEKPPTRFLVRLKWFLG